MGDIFIPALETRLESRTYSKYFLKLSLNFNCSYWIYGALWNIIFGSGLFGIFASGTFSCDSKSLFKFCSSVATIFVSNFIVKLTRPRSTKILMVFSKLYQHSIRNEI